MGDGCTIRRLSRRVAVPLHVAAVDQGGEREAEGPRQRCQRTSWRAGEGRDDMSAAFIVLIHRKMVRGPAPNLPAWTIGHGLVPG